MFPARYFPARYFNPRYWAKVGAAIIITAGRIFIVPAIQRTFTVEAQMRSFVVPQPKRIFILTREGATMFYASKDPSAKLDYTFNWADWLPTGSTVSTSTWTVPTGLVSEATSSTTTTTTIRLSGGTIGNSYSVVNRMTTSAGEIEERSLIITVKEM